MHEQATYLESLNDFYRTQFYPTNFNPRLSGRQELKQLTVLEVAHWGRFVQTAGEEMLEYLGQAQGKNLVVGPTLDEAFGEDE